MGIIIRYLRAYTLLGNIKICAKLYVSGVYNWVACTQSFWERQIQAGRVKKKCLGAAMHGESLHP